MQPQNLKTEAAESKPEVLQLDLSADQSRSVIKILESTIPGCRVWVFGSRVQGKTKPYSDLDLAIDGSSTLSLEKIGLLRERFEQSDLPFRVDLVDWHSCSADFQSIIRQARVQIFPARA